MEIYTATEASQKLNNLIDHIADSHEPICITGTHHKVVVLNEEDFKSIEETLYLLSIPGMRESITQGRKESVKNVLVKLFGNNRP